MSEPVVLRLVITGRVQGVGFRAWLRGEALAAGIGGWVRNRADGSVEAVVEGPPESLDLLCTACRKGPLHARVDHVAISAAGAADLVQRRPGELFSQVPTR